ncbi:hypothetical protein BM221_004473 [Beauveria bassiana]|uniref:Uncharacterized protein n=1 Tax=Beauveria bassiana TaxID=176275 RepID=A0A2N6NRE4_BEABA|nr:hypothetical protein BM221_004473 [Beauveria bassiana]
MALSTTKYSQRPQVNQQRSIHAVQIAKIGSRVDMLAISTAPPARRPRRLQDDADLTAARRAKGKLSSQCYEQNRILVCDNSHMPEKEITAHHLRAPTAALIDQATRRLSADDRGGMGPTGNTE